MKKLIILIVIFIILFQKFVLASEIFDKTLEEQQELIDVNKFEKIMEKMVSEENEQIIQKFDIKKSLKDLSTGNAQFDIKKIFNNVIKFFFKEVYSNYIIIVKIVILSLLCALLQNLKSAFGRDGVGEIAFYACYILIAAILISNFAMALNMGKIVIYNLVGFMQIFIPTIFAMLMVTGNISTATVMQPSVIFGIGILSILIKKIILPIILGYTVLAIVNNISSKIQVSKIAEFIKDVGTWLITIFLTVFISLLSLQSSITAVADGIGTKTAKFAVSTFVPVVGKILSNTVETVVGCSIVLKNSFSIVGMIIIILISLAPVLKLFALIIIYKLAAVLIEPISDERIVKCITQMSKSLSLLVGAVLSVSIMFIICISILVNAGNTASMLRWNNDWNF